MRDAALLGARLLLGGYLPPQPQPQPQPQPHPAAS